MNSNEPDFIHKWFTRSVSFTERWATLGQRLWFPLRDWYLVLRPARMPIIVNVLVFVLYFLVPQGGDLLRRLGEGSAFADQWMDNVRPYTFFAATSLLCMASFYWTYVMLHFDHLQPVLPESHDAKEDRLRLRQSTVKWWRAFLPHFFGAMPLLTLALSAGKAAYKYGQWTPALPLLSRGALFLVAWLVWLRIGVVYVRSPKRKPAKFTVLLDLREVRYGKVMVAILAIPPMFLAGFLIWPVSLGWALGSGTILCLAASGWVSLGSLLVYFGSTYRVPVFAALFSLAVVSSCWMDNHGIRQVEKRMKTPIVAAVPEAGIINEGPLADEARRWLKSRLTGKETKENRRPIFVVAAEGGGIRAAYWTATVLGGLQEASLAEQINDPGQPDFASHVFAISGVSGGSVGAAVFSALLADGYWGANLTNAAQGILSMDHLAPDLGSMMFGDFIQRMVPFDLCRPIHWATGSDSPVVDRATALEKSWEQAYAWWAVRGRGEDPTLRNRLAEGFSLLRQDAMVEPPSLFLNATLVDSGNRFVVSNIEISDQEFTNVTDAMSCFEPARDFFSRDPEKPMEIRLSTAAHLSARFTYFSPAGRLADGRRVVDGGYFENSGAATADEIISRLKQVIEEMGLTEKVIPILVKISNDPARLKQEPKKQLKFVQEQLKDPGLKPERKQKLIQEEQKLQQQIELMRESGMFMSETIAPVSALLNTRTARGVYSEMSARNHQASILGDGDKYFDFGLAEDAVPLPLGWALSREAATEMAEQMSAKYLETPKAKGQPNKTVQTTDNLDAVKRIVGWLKAAPKAPLPAKKED